MRHATIRPLRVLVLTLVLVLAAPATWALEPVFQQAGAAIRGYDPVEYFTGGRPVPGRPDLTATWNGATWRFASPTNREAFLREPERYAPRYGGYCAYAVSRGYTASIDPTAWRIVGGKLYLNYSHRVQKLWEQDVPGNIAKGDRHWPELLRKGE